VPHYKHDCINPCCCTYMGSGDVLVNDKPRYFDVYAYRTLKGTPSEHTALNIRVGDDGPDYHNAALEHMPAAIAKGPQHNALYAAAYEVYHTGLAMKIREEERLKDVRLAAYLRK